MLKKLITSIILLFASQVSLLAMQQQPYQNYSYPAGETTAAYQKTTAAPEKVIIVKNRFWGTILRSLGGALGGIIPIVIGVGIIWIAIVLKSSSVAPENNQSEYE